MTTRRTVIKSASAAIVYRLVGSSPALKAAGPNDQIGFGFIGSGIRGTYLLEEFMKIPGVRALIVADLYDGYLEKAKEQTNGAIRTTKRYEEVLEHPEVDAVVIATPDHWHHRMVLDALRAGKHVYIEKPLTWSIEEGIDLIEATRQSGKLVQVGSQHKTTALTAKARELIQSGALGKVTMVRMAVHRNTPEGAWVYPVPPDASPQTIDWERFLGPAPKRPFDANVFFRWRCWWDFSGGVATDLFVHQLTWLHYVMNVRAPKSVVSQGGLYHWRDGRNVPDVMNSVFEYEGFIADLYVNLATGYPRDYTVVLGNEGTLEVLPDRLILHRHPPGPDVQRYGTYAWPKRLREQYFLSKGWTAEGRPSAPLPSRSQPEEIRVERGPSHTELFVLSLRENRPSVETVEEGHYAAAAAHLANIAYRRNCRVSWDPDTNRVLTD